MWGKFLIVVFMFPCHFAAPWWREAAACITSSFCSLVMRVSSSSWSFSSLIFLSSLLMEFVRVALFLEKHKKIVKKTNKQKETEQTSSNLRSTLSEGRSIWTMDGGSPLLGPQRALQLLGPALGPGHHVLLNPGALQLLHFHTQLPDLDTQKSQAPSLAGKRLAVKMLAAPSLTAEVKHPKFVLQ